jgi:hypothetical protein
VNAGSAPAAASEKYSPVVHENWDDYEILGACHPQKGTNIGDVFTLRHGDVEKGFAEADVIAESDFYCSMLQHVLYSLRNQTAKKC